MLKWFMGVFSSQNEPTKFHANGQIISTDSDPDEEDFDDDIYDMDEDNDEEYEEYHDDVVILDPNFYGNADR
ncbi:hypothetical protein ACERII_24465 [Evansella sp. AB-rgal1]|uniref:hypothetical protein n=1 Tax=Evansella sp. AB-rgal1 TaxID=3242696 RepID=UPI00359EF3CF